MKNLNSILIVIAVVSFVCGCDPKDITYGQPITETKITPIGDILSRPEKFAGKSVVLGGKITDECPVGGWFYLKDDTGIIYVNLHPSYFVIPQVRGREVIAQGKVRKEGTQIEIIGEGVRLK